MRHPRRLTGTVPPRTLLPVQRLLAATTAMAMLLTFGSAVPRHVHTFAGHDHDHDHDHGVADHLHLVGTHAAHGRGDADHAPAIEGCDPGTHAVFLTCVGASPESGQALVAVAIESIVVRLPQGVRSSITPPDVRVHGPPRSRRTPSRAPPVVHPA